MARQWLLKTGWPLRLLLLAALAGVTAPRLLLDEASAIRPMAFWWTALFTAWWAAPLALLLIAARTTLVVGLGGAGYIVIAAVLQAAAYRNEHSTAFFGVLFTPAFLTVGVILLLLGEEVAKWLGDRSRDSDAPR
jgi:hypothetical protein